MSDLYWLTDEQMERLQPFFPKSRGKPRVDDRKVLSGIIFINRNGLRWRDAPAAYQVAEIVWRLDGFPCSSRLDLAASGRWPAPGRVFGLRRRAVSEVARGCRRSW